MRTRSFLGILLGLLVVVVVAFLTSQNADLLTRPFRLTSGAAVPLYAVLLAIFLAGFLPTATILFAKSLRRDLVLRQRRRAHREAESLDRTLRRAVDFQSDGQWRKAAEEIKVVLDSRPDDFSALLRYGETLRHLGEIDQALEVHRRASVLYPRSVALLYQLAEDYEAQGEADVAREIRNRILRDFPGMGLQILRRRRKTALAARQWREAAHLQEQIEARLEDLGDEGGLRQESGVSRGLVYQRGVALMEEERYGEAAALFEQLLAEEPRFIPAAIMVGEAHLLLGDEERALSEWLRGYEQSGSPIFLQRIEDHFIEGEQPARAIETLRALIARADNDLLPRFFLGRLYYRLEMHGEALKVLEAVGDRIRSSPTYHFLLGRIHERRGEMKLALEAYVACARQLGVRTTEYRCRVCDATYPDWRDRCDRCGSWNSVELDFQEEKLTPEQLGLQPAPVWGGYEEDEGGSAEEGEPAR